jgi:hypothetical protein
MRELLPASQASGRSPSRLLLETSLQAGITGWCETLAGSRAGPHQVTEACASLQDSASMAAILSLASQ